MCVLLYGAFIVCMCVRLMVENIACLYVCSCCNYCAECVHSALMLVMYVSTFDVLCGCGWIQTSGSPKIRLLYCVLCCGVYCEMNC